MPAARRRLRFPSPKSQCQRAPYRTKCSAPAHHWAGAPTCGPKPVSGLGGRRGFYARRFPMSTTFLRSLHFFQLFLKHPKNQRFGRDPARSYSPHECLGVATNLTYRFPSLASSSTWVRQVRFAHPSQSQGPDRRGRLIWAPSPKDQPLNGRYSQV